MLMDMPTDLLQSESARLTNELAKPTRIPSPEFFGKLIETKIQLIDLEIIRRGKQTLSDYAIDEDEGRGRLS